MFPACPFLRRTLLRKIGLRRTALLRPESLPRRGSLRNRERDNAGGRGEQRGDDLHPADKLAISLSK